MSATTRPIAEKVGAMPATLRALPGRCLEQIGLALDCGSPAPVAPGRVLAPTSVNPGGMAAMTLRILVVGAGIAGLAAARALRVAGFRPDIVEELPATTVPKAGIYLPGNASRALRRLGLDAGVRPFGDLIFRQLFSDARGRELFEVDVAALWAGVGESRALSRGDLQQVLLSGVGGEVRYDTPVRELAIDGGTAKVEFGDDSIAEYDLVVGADGRRSTIRAKAGLGGPAEPTGQIVYRSVVSGGPPVSDWIGMLGRRVGVAGVGDG